jgi:hypothetical protein
VNYLVLNLGFEVPIAVLRALTREVAEEFVEGRIARHGKFAPKFAIVDLKACAYDPFPEAKPADPIADPFAD